MQDLAEALSESHAAPEASQVGYSLNRLVRLLEEFPSSGQTKVEQPLARGGAGYLPESPGEVPSGHVSQGRHRAEVEIVVNVVADVVNCSVDTGIGTD